MPSKKETITPQSTANFQLDSSQSTYQQLPSSMATSAPVIERELKQILPQIRSDHRQAVAQQFLKYLANKGIEKHTLKRNLALATTNVEHMLSEDVSKVGTYAYQHHPDVFQTVLTQPSIVQFLSHPILSAIVGIMAAKWLNQSPS